LATGEQQKLGESRLLDFLGKKRSGEWRTASGGQETDP